VRGGDAAGEGAETQRTEEAKKKYGNDDESIPNSEEPKEQGAGVKSKSQTRSRWLALGFC
jgi:hypothetical protein